MLRVNRTQNDRLKCPDLPARYLFVVALRARCPYLFRSLNELWKKGSILDRDAPGVSPLDKWFEQMEIVDGWLIDYVVATIQLWEGDPDGGNAKLDPDFRWFAVPEDAIRDDEELPPFLLIPVDRYPRYGGPPGLSRLGSELQKLSIDDLEGLLEMIGDAGWFESLEQYQKRVTDEARQCILAHVQRLRIRMYGRDNAESFKHAQWAALAFSGMAYAEIALHELAGTSNRDPESTVRKAVVRFAKSVDLTLPIRRRSGRPARKRG